MHTYAPYSNELAWIVGLGFLIAFFLAFGVGANDVANSFGTSVGSGVLTFKQACVLATIFEILGAVLMGHKVSDTVRKSIFDIEMYSSEEDVLMMGYLSALIGSAVWNFVATWYGLPISGTHSIIGAVLGFTVVAKGFTGIYWKTFGFIAASWFLSPLLSGIISVLLFLLIRYAILNKQNYIHCGLVCLPFFYGFTVFVNVFSVVHDGTPLLGFHTLPWWVALTIALSICVATAVGIQLFMVPRLRRGLGDTNRFPTRRTEELQEFQREPSRNPAVCENEEVLNCIRKDDDDEEKDDKPEISYLFKALQILTAIFGAFAHGGNDVSNAIAPFIGIWLIYSQGAVKVDAETPIWILAFGGVGISCGLFAMGKKVIQTIGKDLTKITPSSGFTIEIGAATTALLASKIGLPISTTHCKVGSVVSVGYVRSTKEQRVDLKLFRNIILAWFVTLPATAAFSACAMAILYASRFMKSSSQG